MGIEYVITILTFTGITLIGVLGAYMVTGLTGLFSFGQAAFLAIGAYVSAVLMKDYQVALPFAMLAAIAVGVLCGLVVGLPTVRLRRDYISLVTFGFGEAIIALLTNSASITGGAMGLSGIPFPWPDGWGGLEPNAVWLIVVGISVVICLAVVVSYKYSKYGRQCLALRSDELAAKSMGINVTKLKQIKVRIPELENQRMFAAFVERVDQQKQTIQQSLEKLELLKKALMQEYFG